MKVALIGGSGFLGSDLRRRLIAGGHNVVVIGRSSTKDHGDWQSVQWDAANLGAWVSEVDGADVLVHLAGKRVDCRPTRSNIDELISSREGTVRLVGRALDDMAQPPQRWVQLSSLAIFGDAGDQVITEDTAPAETGPRQQVEVCRRWEAAYRDATANTASTVLLRPAIGIGGAGDPATAQLSRLARLGLAGPVGGGKQWVSWIGQADMSDLLLRAVVDPSMDGLYHLTAPEPVPNSDLMAAYRDAVGRKYGLATPAWMATVGAWLLGSDPGLALTGRRCIPGRLSSEGYQFKVTDITQAVHAAVTSQS